VASALGIPLAEHERRAAQLGEQVRAAGLRGAVVFDALRVQYLTGFAFAPTERPIAFVLGPGGERALFVPRLEVEHAAGQTGLDHIAHYPEYPGEPTATNVLAGLLAELGMRNRIGADLDGYPWILGYRGPTLSELTGATVVPIAGAIEDLMAVKSEAEVTCLRESVRWAELAHRLLQRFTRPGASETGVSRRAGMEATVAMLEALGDRYRAGNPFVDGAMAGYRGQIGRNSAIPHTLAGNITFEVGDVLVSGATAPVWGYLSELERTLVIGPPSNEQRRLFDHATAAQQVAFDAIRPGVHCSDVDLAVRAYYDANGLWDRWRHHTGHAIGLRYHEGPFLDLGDHTEIRPGMVFTVEPGLYHPDLGGFRHSDTVLVTEDGIDVLTTYPRDLDALIVPAG
jgi:Xaa-Pro aminopeptidase